MQPSILCSALKPLDDLYSIEKVIVSTYQSVSGNWLPSNAGFKTSNPFALDDLSYNSPYFPSLKSKVKYQMAFNCVPQVGNILENQYSTEEEKMILETQKILQKILKFVQPAFEYQRLIVIVNPFVLNLKKRLI